MKSAISYLCRVLLLSITFVLPPHSGSANDTIDQELPIPPIRLACTSFPPFKIEGNTEYPGIDVEVLEAAFKRIDIPYIKKFAPWKRTYEDVLAGRFDALCGCSHTKEREGYFYFSAPVGQIETVFFLRSGDQWEIGLDNLPEDKIVGVVRGYSLENELIERGAKYTTAKDDKQLLKMLIGGRVDAIYSFREPLEWHMKIQNTNVDLKAVSVRSTRNYACFGKHHAGVPYFLRAFNQALADIKSSGQLDEIKARYK